MPLPIFPTLPGLTYTMLKTSNFNTLVQGSPNSYEVRIQQTINPVWSFSLIFDFLHDFFWGGFTAVSELRTLMGFYNQMGGRAQSFLYLDSDDSNVGPALSTAVWTANTSYLLGQGILDAANHWQIVTTAGTSGATIPTFNDSGGNTNEGPTLVWHDNGHYSASGFPNTFLAGLSIVQNSAGDFFSPIQRTLNGYFFEDVTDLNGSIAVYDNGVLQTVGGPGLGDYTIGGPGLATPTQSYMGLYIQWNDEPDGPVTVAFNFYFRVRFDGDAQDFEKWAGTGSAQGFPPAGQGGGLWTIGGSESQNGSGTLKLTTARPTPL
jgi:hypothetical protein